MYRLVIIEDELVVRRNIIKKVKWNEYGFEVVGEAENGRDALEIIEALNPDVVITDIEMPFMDGLELTAVVREKYPTTKIIILTGFQEFKYAQKAVELNIVEYILKPLSSSDMEKLLIKIKEQLDKEVAEKEDRKALMEHYIQSIPIMRANFLNTLITSKHQSDEVVRRASYLNLNLNGNMFLVSVISVDMNLLDGASFKYDEFELARFAVLNTAEEIINKYNMGIVFCYENYVVVIFTFDRTDKINLINEAFRVLEEIRQCVEKYLKQTVTIGIGEFCASIGNISDSFRKALAALDYRFVTGNNRLIYIKDLEPQNHERILFDDNKEKLILTSIKIGSDNGINDVIEKIFDEIVEVKASFNDYQVYLLELLSSIVKFAKELEVEMGTIFEPNYNIFLEIFKFNTLDELKEWFKKICIKLSNFIAVRRVNSCKMHAERARDYIKGNYNNSELSMNQVSNFLHISPSYFGAIFKEETGETFTSFLLKVRMENAKDLICTTNLKNFEVAEKVGYTDQHYFSYCFKRYFKVSPNEYRNSLNKS
jgi:two-component system, response regulator YesN